MSPLIRCLRATCLSLLALALLQVAVDQSEAGLRDRLGRPVKYIYGKIRDIGHRNVDRYGRQRQRLDGFASTIGRQARGTDEDYKAMCVFSRGPSLKKSPVLYYFSNEANLRGCQVDVNIELNSIGDEYRQLNDQFARASINSKLLASHIYEPTRPTYVLTHGFLSDWTGNWLCETKDLILSRTKANVFILDWSGGSKPMVPLDYGSSVSNTQYVANLLSRFLELLIDMSQQHDASRFHLIGHSLGAHISGFVGYALNGQVGQITGLDPAGPCFTTNSEAESARAEVTGEMHKRKRRLSPESAKFVLALHTDINLFGLDENCAHYDVYVNGGIRQPKCPAMNPLQRFGDLLHLNLGMAFNFNMVCCHSYAHKLLDSFVDFTNWGQLQQRQQQPRQVAASALESNTNRDVCYPMAYKCPDWVSFQAGECGFCHDNDTHCVYTGISLYDFQVRKSVEDNLEYQWSRPQRGEADDEDDIEFNDERENQDDRTTSEEDEDYKRRLSNEAGQHFFRAAADHPTCLFQYQILIAARHEDATPTTRATTTTTTTADTNEKPSFYLHLPLERSGLFHDAAGHRLQDRLVQVSHKIDSQSPVYGNLRLNYMSALEERLGEQPLEGANLALDFYSALITFKQAPNDSCRPDNNGAPLSRGCWQLCEPLANIQMARLWSSSVQRLQSVQWVALNYMSGLTYEQRMQSSYAFLKPSPQTPIKSRDEIDRAQQAKLGSLNLRPARSLITTTKCLMSVLDLADITNMRNDYKCKRSSSELRYAIELVPKKL